MKRSLLEQVLPKGPELLRRLALAEVLGPPPSAAQRREELQGNSRGPRELPGRPQAPGERRREG